MRTGAAGPAGISVPITGSRIASTSRATAALFGVR
jgi:hypothetical protein